jgi:ATP-dependent Lon protease
MDFPLDLSNVLFICTANDISSISKPLLDRMIHIEIPGYSDSEKEEIFWRYILPESIKNSGLNGYEDLFEINKEILKPLLEGYCRESGVRALSKSTSKILEKIAFKVL